MESSGGSGCSFGYNEGLSQSFYVDFPCGFGPNGMKNIESIQGQSHKN